MNTFLHKFFVLDPFIVFMSDLGLFWTCPFFINLSFFCAVANVATIPMANSLKEPERKHSITLKSQPKSPFLLKKTPRPKNQLQLEVSMLRKSLVAILTLSSLMIVTEHFHGDLEATAVLDTRILLLNLHLD